MSDGAFLQPSCSEYALPIAERTRIAVPAGSGMPSQFMCKRCGYHAFPWVGAEDASRPGCSVWVCFVCSRLFEVIEAGSEV